MKPVGIPGIPDSASKAIIDLLKFIPGQKGLVLFGSRAKGNFREGSDIDIAVMGNGVDIGQKDRFLLKYEDLYLPWKLDLIFYETISEPALKEHIQRVGISLSS